LEATLQVWLHRHSICVGGTEQLLEHSRQERADPSSQKEACQKLVEFVQSGSSISSLRSLLQVSIILGFSSLFQPILMLYPVFKKTFEASETVHTSAAISDVLLGVGEEVDHSINRSGHRRRTPLCSVEKTQGSLPRGYSGDSQNQHDVSEGGVHRSIGLPCDRVSGRGSSAAAPSNGSHCDHWDSSIDASSSLSSSDSLSDA
jgi:hypothetical protein